MARLIRGAAELLGNWEACGLGPGQTASSPEALALLSQPFREAAVPGTAASARRQHGELDITRPPDLDAEEWWYRSRFHTEPGPHVLRFDGLATLADVWLNGEHVLESSNMFLAHEVVRDLRGDNELALRFRSLAAWLDEKRPRPRYKTRLVKNQKLRWARTTLLGRMPGLPPCIAPVGPFRPITLERLRGVRLESAHVTTAVDGKDGVVRVTAIARADGARVPESATLVVGQDRVRLERVEQAQGLFGLAGTLRIPNVALHWPHTHGPQPLYAAHLAIASHDGETLTGLGHLGFRTLQLLDDPSRFELLVNGVRIFCRGACWTPVDVVSLNATPDEHRRTLGALRAAGMNMIRVSGTTLYEADDLYDACDELGFLVWQDFMFANMDYPFSDPVFSATVRAEAEQAVSRLETHPSVAVLCGGSEVGQQAAMLGLPREGWYGELYELALRDIAHASCPGVPYVKNSPCGEPLPFTPSRGAAHYYGVGAYQRPLSDARLAQVKFASECLAFANVPNEAALEELGVGSACVSHPTWKERVPRDVGASWDFDDVRDHYFETLFHSSPAEVRRTDPERYLAMSRFVTGEVMAQVFGEWRRLGSSTSGGLIWFARDAWPGAGFGVLDSRGRPKPALYVLGRVLAPTALLAVSEGLGGLVLHAVHDGAEPLEAVVRARLFLGETVVGSGERAIIVPARGSVAVSVEEMLGAFADTTYAYRFGPPGHDCIAATLHAGERTVARATYLPLGYPTERSADVGLKAELSRDGSGRYLLHVLTRRLAVAVHIDAPGFAADDDWFHLPPGGTHTVLLVPTEAQEGPKRQPRGRLVALNMIGETRIPEPS